MITETLQNEINAQEETVGNVKLSGLLDVNLKIDRERIPQMFTYDVDSWFETLFAIKGRTLPWRPWLLIMLITTCMILVDDKFEISILGVGVMDKYVNSVVHSTFGVVLGFLIVYQSTQSSNRWWAARVSWENIITHSREVTRIMCCHCNGKEVIKLFAKYLIGFAVTTKHYLTYSAFNKESPSDELSKIFPEDELSRLYQLPSRNRPMACLYVCQRITELSIKNGLFLRPVSRDINPRFHTLANELGICEQILFTPMPWVYTLHLRVVLVAFLILTPLAMFGEDPLPSISQIYLFVGIISYAFLGLEDMAVKIQNPFGKHASDLPLEIFTFVQYRDIKDVIHMKYKAFNKTYSDRLFELGKAAIEWKKRYVPIEEDDEADDADD